MAIPFWILTKRQIVKSFPYSYLYNLFSFSAILCGQFVLWMKKLRYREGPHLAQVCTAIKWRGQSVPRACPVPAMAGPLPSYNCSQPPGVMIICPPQGVETVTWHRCDAHDKSLLVCLLHWFYNLKFHWYHNLEWFILFLWPHIFSLKGN